MHQAPGDVVPCIRIPGFNWSGPQNGSEWILWRRSQSQLFCCAIWGPLLPKKILEFNCDNCGLVNAIDKCSSKEPVAMQLLRCQWFFLAFYEITVRASHIPGMLNTAADMLSRYRTVQFLSSHSYASHILTPVPTPLLRIVSRRCLDWPPQLSSDISDALFT